MPPKPMRLPSVRRGHCHPCGGETSFRFSGFATDGAEGSAKKPRSAHYACRTCGHTVLTLGNVHDTEGLCRTTVKRRITADARHVEADDAIAYLYWHAWRLYLGWQPERLTFLAYAAHWLPRRLDAFLADATGDAGQRRQSPKAHSVSDSYDALAEQGHVPDGTRSGSGLDEAVGLDDRDADDDRRSSLRRILGRGDSGGPRRVAV